MTHLNGWQEKEDIHNSVVEMGASESGMGMVLHFMLEMLIDLRDSFGNNLQSLITTVDIRLSEMTNQIEVSASTIEDKLGAIHGQLKKCKKELKNIKDELQDIEGKMP